MKIKIVEQYVLKVNFKVGGWGQYGCPDANPEGLEGVVASMLRYNPGAEYVIERQLITTRSEVIEWKPTAP